MTCGDCGHELTAESLEGTFKGSWYVCEGCRKRSQLNRITRNDIRADLIRGWDIHNG